MALIVKDRVKQSAAAPGTGTITLGSTPTGFQSFAAVGDTNTTYFAIVDPVSGAWEVNYGVYTSSGTTLTRNATPLSSSNSGSLVNFTGAVDVFVTYPSEKAVYEDTAGVVTFTDNPIFSAGTANGVTYLNGSKVLTSGSALTFDGTTFGVNVAASIGSSTAKTKFYSDSTYNGIFNGASLGSNEAIYMGGGSQFFYAGGAETFRTTSTSLYTASGINVGFGTSSTTSYKLNVLAAFSSGIGGAYIEAGEFNQSALIVNHTNAAVAVPLFQVQKSGTGVLTLTSSGTLQKSGTNGVMQLMDGNTAGGVKIGAYTANLLANGYLVFEGYSIEYGRFDALGNLCVGSSSAGNAGTINISVGAPSTTIGGLQLWSTTAGTHYLQFGDGTAGTAPYSGAIGYNHTADNLVFYSAGVLAMTLTSSSLFTANAINVGFGTSSTTVRLTSNTISTGLPATSGTTQTNGAFRISSNATSGVLDFGTNSGAPWIQATDRSDLSQKYDILLNPNGGRVGFGDNNPNTPVAILGSHVSGQGILKIRSDVAFSSGGLASIAFNDSDNVRKGMIYANSSGVKIETGSSSITFSVTGSGDAATIDTSGRLLVGTTSNFGGAGQFAIDQSGGSVPIMHLVGTQGVGGGGRTVGLIFSGVYSDTGPAYGNFGRISAAKENGTQGNSAGSLSLSTTPNGGTLTERMFISSTGNVTIGSSSSIGGDAVQIFSTMPKVASSTGWGIVVIDTNTDGAANRGGAIAFSALRTDGGRFNAGAVSGAKSNSSGLNEDGDLVLYSSAGSVLTERVRVLYNGNVGIGTNNPQNRLQVVNTTRPQFSVSYEGTTGLYLEDSTNNSYKSWKLATSTLTGSALEFYKSTTTSGVPTWEATPSMMLNSDGYFLLGTLNPTPFTDTTGTGGLAMRPNRLFVSSDADCGSFTRIASDGIIWYYARSGSGNVGNVSVTTTGTAYNTTSDYRLKNVTGSLTGYKERLMSLQPKQGIWVANGSEFKGFIAHEFANQYPKSVTGEKDAVDADGKPVMQSMQASSSEVMADLVALVQEQQAIIESLKARLDAANL